MKAPAQIYQEARAAGLAAGHATRPVPMILGYPSTPLGNDIDPNQKTYFVESGICGFAWVKIHPARGAFVKWAKENNLGRIDSDAGGFSIWVYDFGQSMQRKENYAAAFAKVLCQHGLRAHSESRMD